MTVAGEYGLLVPFLRQSWRLRHTGNVFFRRQMRRDIRHCVAMLRHNRALTKETA